MARCALGGRPPSRAGTDGRCKGPHGLAEGSSRERGAVWASDEGSAGRANDSQDRRLRTTGPPVTVGRLGARATGATRARGRRERRACHGGQCRTEVSIEACCRQAALRKRASWQTRERPCAQIACCRASQRDAGGLWFAAIALAAQEEALKDSADSSCEMALPNAAYAPPLLLLLLAAPAHTGPGTSTFRTTSRERCWCAGMAGTGFEDRRRWLAAEASI